MIADLFAGPGGWDTGLAMLGVIDVLGVEKDNEACATGCAAGHQRVQGDIAMTQPHEVAGYDVEGLIASPPCQGFSMAGKGKGRADTALVMRAVEDVGSGRAPSVALDTLRSEASDHRTALVLEPLRWALDLEPEWLAWEQVPAVLPLWEACADVLRADGWNVWCGNVQAEQYGVPQTRKRAILTAHRSRQVGRPTPTHSRYYPRNPTKLDDGLLPWVSMAEALGDRSDLAEWAYCRPSTTIVDSFKPEVVAAPGYRTTISRQNAPDSVTVSVVEAGILQSFPPFHWAHRRPATTVQGDARLPEPGHRCYTDDCHPGRKAASMFAPNAVRLSMPAASVLQSFPADYPWSGSKTAQYRQVGGAVPPLLAAHVLASLGVGQLASERAA